MQAPASPATLESAKKGFCVAKRAKKIAAGEMVTVRDGVTMPEFPSLDIGGWTAMVLEAKGRGADVKYIVEWTDESRTKMSSEYLAHAESQQLATEFACLEAQSVSTEAS